MSPTNKPRQVLHTLQPLMDVDGNRLHPDTVLSINPATGACWTVGQARAIRDPFQTQGHYFGNRTGSFGLNPR